MKKSHKKFGEKKNCYIFVSNVKQLIRNEMKNLTVKYTKNLGMFKTHHVNREIDRLRVKRIANSMKTDGLKRVPIIVTSEYIVVDGQHRLTAAEEAKKGIYFLVDDTIPNTTIGIFEAARSFNQNMKEWGKKDYIHGFCEQGKIDYQILTEFSKQYPMFSLTERIMLLQNSGTRHVAKKDFADGKFVVADTYKAKKWADDILSLKPFFETGYNKSVFVRTLITIMEKKPEFVFEEFLHKVRLRPGMIYLCGDKKSYTAMIEELYNYRRKVSEKLNLRF